MICLHLLDNMRHTEFTFECGACGGDEHLAFDARRVRCIREQTPVVDERVLLPATTRRARGTVESNQYVARLLVL